MKTPKDKAEELYDQINILIPIDAQLSDTGKQASDKMIKDHKATLFICHKLVDEILFTLSNIESTTDGVKCYNFYEEVKNELNNML